MKNYSIAFFADLKIYVFKPIFKSLSKIILLGENFFISNQTTIQFWIIYIKSVARDHYCVILIS